MSALTRPPSHGLPTLARRLSLEQTYSVAHTARRKSSSQTTRNDLRLQLAHTNVLELALHDISLSESVTSSPASSPPTSPKASASHMVDGKHIAWAAVEVVKASRYQRPHFEYEEYDDGEEDLESLSLVRVSSRSEQR